jgi:hypothetical protein
MSTTNNKNIKYTNKNVFKSTIKKIDNVVAKNSIKGIMNNFLNLVKLKHI